MSGILLAETGAGGFIPYTVAYTTAGTYTITLDSNATNVMLELFGNSGSGGLGNLTIPTQGGGGGSAGKCVSQYTVAGLGGAGKTLTLTLNVAGSAANATIVAGTATGFTTMTAPAGGVGGSASGVADGTGGAAGAITTGGNVSNATGNAGSAGAGLGTGTGLGGAAVTGVHGNGNSGANGTYSAVTRFTGKVSVAYVYYS